MNSVFVVIGVHRCSSVADSLLLCALRVFAAISFPRADGASEDAAKTQRAQREKTAGKTQLDADQAQCPLFIRVHRCSSVANTLRLCFPGYLATWLPGVSPFPAGVAPSAPLRCTIPAPGEPRPLPHPPGTVRPRRGFFHLPASPPLRLY